MLTSATPLGCIQHVSLRHISWIRKRPKCRDARAIPLNSGNHPSARAAPVEWLLTPIDSGQHPFLSYRTEKRRLNARDAYCKQRMRAPQEAVRAKHERELLSDT